MNSKNICIVINSLVEAGAEKQSVILASLLKDSYNVHVVILYDIISIENKKRLETNNLNVYILRGNNIILKGLDFYKYVKNYKIEIVFSYLANGNFLNGVIGSMAGVKHRIGGIRNAELSTKKLPFERFFHNRLLTKTISNSHSAVNSLMNKGFKETKFHVIHNAFDLHQPLLKRANTKICNILSVARFVPQKDFYTALKSISSLKKLLESSKYDFRYLLIGYGEQEEQIRNWVKELNISDKVEIIIKPDNLNEYYKKADIFLTTSLFEGLSNSVMEAMSFSLPVVATKAGDMEYLVKENENGFLVDIKDYVTISDRLKKLVMDYDLRMSMGVNGYSLLKNNFSMEKFKNNYILFINSLNG